MNFKKIIILLVLIIQFNILYSESYGNNTIETILENIAETQTIEDADLAIIRNKLISIIENPINLNNTNWQQLSQLIFLNSYQLRSLLTYIYSKNGIHTKYELKNIDGFRMKDIKMILPFIRFGDKKKSNSFTHEFKYGRHKFVTGLSYILQNQSAYKKNKYLGNKYKNFIIYNFKSLKKIKIGFKAEKDAGEEFFKGSNKNGYDLYTGFIQFNNFLIFKKIIIGDFRLNFGQGLICFSGLSNSKGSQVINIEKFKPTLQSYNSSDEYKYFRGISSLFNINNLELTLFFSRKLIDVNNIKNNDLEFKSIITHGYHRTESEIKNKDNVEEVNTGGRLKFTSNHFNSSVNLIFTKYSKPIAKSDKLINKFNMYGDKILNSSIDYKYKSKYVDFFGETAISKHHELGVATLNSFWTHLTPNFSLLSLYRYYDKKYKSVYSQGFSESSTTNENGLYIGFEFFPYNKIQLLAYFDSYYFDFPKFNVTSPSEGVDYFSEIHFPFGSNNDFYIRYKEEIKEENQKKLQTTNIIKVTKRQIRFHTDYSILKNLKLSNRLELSFYQKGNKKSEGFLFYQNIKYLFNKTHITLYLRYIIFDTNNNSKIYTYENDMLYSFSIPAFIGKGSKIYILAKYKINNYIKCSARFSNLNYNSVNSIGTGNALIIGNNKSELKFQITIKI